MPTHLPPSLPPPSPQLGGATTKQSCLDVGGLLFFMAIFMSFQALLPAVFTFPAEFQMLVKV